MPTSDELRLLAGRQVFARYVKDDVTAVDKAAREVLEPHLRPGETVVAELPDGTPVGSVRRNKASTSGYVADADALLAWVKKHRPDEIVESVNPAFVKKCTDQAKSRGHAFTEDGEVIPGVESRVGGASYVPDVADEAKPTLQARLAELIGDGLLAIETEREAS